MTDGIMQSIMKLIFLSTFNQSPNIWLVLFPISDKPSTSLAEGTFLQNPKVLVYNYRLNMVLSKYSSLWAKHSQLILWIEPYWVTYKTPHPWGSPMQVTKIARLFLLNSPKEQTKKDFYTLNNAMMLFDKCVCFSSSLNNQNISNANRGIYSKVCAQIF